MRRRALGGTALACWVCWALVQQELGRWGVRRWGAQGERGREALAGARALAERSGQAAARAAGAGMGARGAGGERAERAAWAREARGVGVPVRAGWACWLVSWAKLVHSAPGSVLTQFFLDPIRLGIFFRVTK